MSTLLQRNSFLRGILVLLLCVVGLGNAWGQNYKLITSTEELEAGKTYMIASMADGDGYVMNGYVSGNNCRQTAANASNNIITFSEGMGKLTLDGNSGAWTFNDGTYYLDATLTTNDNYLKGSADVDEYNKFSISFSGNEAVITCTGKDSRNILRYNANSKLFSCYNSGQNPVYLFKETNQEVATLTSISISGTPTTTEYYVGDTPNADGLSVNATYSDESTSTVTPTWTFSPETIEEGTTQVTATATYGGMEDSFFFDIKVNIAYFYTLDLTTKTYYEAEKSHVYWDANVVHLASNKSSGSTNANNYLGGDDNDRTSSRFYTYNTITITPKTTITKIIFSATSSNYAQALSNSEYTNATATQDGNDIIITPDASDQPINITVANTCGCTEVKVFYEPLATTISDAGYATLCLPYSAIVPDGITAYTATDAGEYIKLSAMESGKIAANEGVVLKGESGEYTFVATSEAVTATEGNQMVGVTEETALSANDNAYMLTSDNDHENVAFRLLATDYTLAANKAYLKASDTEARTLISVMWDDNATGIENINSATRTQNDAIFNLAGQKLRHAQKGINIVNGKLVIK